MRARRKRIKRLDDRNLRAKGIVTTSRASDALASAMKNILHEKPEVAIDYLVDVFDYIMETKTIDNEVWKRYQKKRKEARKKSLKLKELLRSPPKWTYFDFDLDNSSSNWSDVLYNMDGEIIHIE